MTTGSGTPTRSGTAVPRSLFSGAHDRPRRLGVGLRRQGHERRRLRGRGRLDPGLPRPDGARSSGVARRSRPPGHDAGDLPAERRRHDAERHSPPPMPGRSRSRCRGARYGRPSHGAASRHGSPQYTDADVRAVSARRRRRGRGGADGIYRGRGDRYRTGPLHPSRTGAATETDASQGMAVRLGYAFASETDTAQTITVTTGAQPTLTQRRQTLRVGSRRSFIAQSAETDSSRASPSSWDTASPPRPIRLGASRLGPSLTPRRRRRMQHAG